MMEENATPLFNGNIATTNWRTASDDVLRKYSYDYDHLNRLKYAHYQKPGITAQRPGSYDESLSYDKNGNIQTLNRFGYLDNDNGTVVEIDKLFYDYTHNQLDQVYDQSNSINGFKDRNVGSTDYEYDENGNMTVDKNKGILNIVYNHLNLPTSIVFENEKYISYIYNAVGVKLQKFVNDMANPVTTDYLSGFQYSSAAAQNPYNGLQFFPHAEGYVDAYGNQFNYVYNYTDHLGNIRLSYGEEKRTGFVKIIEENNYYPFGLKHSNYNLQKSDFVPAVLGSAVNLDAEVELKPVARNSYQYKYNGKELQDELGLNLYDYGARFYDPALGRWMNVDPLAEQMRRHSPYNYAFNNPIYFIDPDGMAPSPPDDIYVNTKTSQVSVIKTNDKNDRVIVDGKNTGITEKGEYKNTYKGYSTNEVKINYGGDADKSKVSDYSTSVIVDIMNASGNSFIMINSTLRTPEDQARIMSDLVNKNGMNDTKVLYSSNGDKVLDKFPSIQKMVDKINEIGPVKVSNHLGDPSIINVVDISPWRGGITNPKGFAKEASDAKPKTSEVLTPWNSRDKAIHIAIPQPKK